MFRRFCSKEWVVSYCCRVGIARLETPFSLSFVSFQDSLCRKGSHWNLRKFGTLRSRRNFVSSLPCHQTEIEKETKRIQKTEIQKTEIQKTEKKREKEKEKEKEQVLLRVIEEGEGDETIVFVHGWPDNYHIFNKQIFHFSKYYRCIRIVIPFYGDSTDESGAISGNGKRYNKKGYNFDQIGNMISETIKNVCGSGPVIHLVAHDWGVYWASYFQNHLFQKKKQHPEMVKKMVLLDVECPSFMRPTLSQVPVMVLLGVYYQWWLILAWQLTGIPLIGNSLGTFIFQWMVRKLRHSAKGKDHLPQDDIAELTPLSGFPYYYFQTNFVSGLFFGSPLNEEEDLKKKKDIKKSFPLKKPSNPNCPCLYLFGKRKKFHFHSNEWVEQLQKREGCDAFAVDGSHWFFWEESDVVNEKIEYFLQKK